FDRLPVRRLFLGPKLAGLLGEVHQDGARLKQRAAVVAVYDRGDAVVGADLEEVGLELFVLGDIDGVGGVGKAALLQHDGHFAAVRGRPRVEIDHRGILKRDARGCTGRCGRVDERATLRQQKGQGEGSSYPLGQAAARWAASPRAQVSPHCRESLRVWCWGRAGRVLPYRRAALGALETSLLYMGYLSVRRT